MSSCCDKPETLTHASGKSTAALTIALAGNPNSGKTTIFNALTGLRQKVANYPGVTVEKKVGRCKLAGGPGGKWCSIIDLPGTYSLISRSPDEQVAMEVLRGLRSDVTPPGVVVVVVDASNLQRNLYLVSQLIELGRPLVVALNMMDVAQRRGIGVSADKLRQELGVPVIPVVGYKRQGIAELKQAILDAKVAPLPNWALPDAMKEELLMVGGGLAILDVETRGQDKNRDGSYLSPPGSGTENRDGSYFLSDDVSVAPTRAWICREDSDRKLDRYEALAERLLIGDQAADMLPLREHEPVSSLLSAASNRLHQLGIDPMQADVEAHYRWIETIASRVTSAVSSQNAGTLPYATPAPAPKNLTERVDAILVHKV